MAKPSDRSPERKARRTGQSIDHAVFPEVELFVPEGLVEGHRCCDLRWSQFKKMIAADMFEVIEKYVFPFLAVAWVDSTHAKDIRGYHLTFPTPRSVAEGGRRYRGDSDG